MGENIFPQFSGWTFQTKIWKNIATTVTQILCGMLDQYLSKRPEQSGIAFGSPVCITASIRQWSTTACGQKLSNFWRTTKADNHPGIPLPPLNQWVDLYNHHWWTLRVEKSSKLGKKTLFNHYFNGGFSAQGPESQEALIVWPTYSSEICNYPIILFPYAQTLTAENKYVLVQIKTCV